MVEKLSIIVPVFNEGATVAQMLGRLRGIHFPVECEIIVVDDASTDNSAQVLRSLAKPIGFKLVQHVTNGGKGAAVRTGLSHVTGEVVVVQDADLELDPSDLPALLAPILAGEADACYGSRFLTRVSLSMRLRPAYWANAMLNGLSNVLNGLRITDFNTCYKMMRTRTMRQLDLSENGFAMEAEITGKLARLGQRIVERPISYTPRSKEDGKKIRPRDVLTYLTAMFQYRFGRAVNPSVQARATVIGTGAKPG